MARGKAEAVVIARRYEVPKTVGAEIAAKRKPSLGKQSSGKSRGKAR